MPETFTTPEGFDLPKPLLLPDVRGFTELFEYVREWNHATMTSGPRMADHTLIPQSVRVDEMDIGPFLSMTVAGARRSLAIIPTRVTVDALATPSGVFAVIVNEGTVSFELFEHRANGRVLVVAKNNLMARDQYLAYIDPATIPTPKK